MEYAEYVFRRGQTVADGSTQGDHLDSAARQLATLPGRKRTAPTIIIPDEPPFPEELRYLFFWFIDICAGLASTGFGPAMVTWEAITAWQRLMDIGPVEPWEVRVLVDLGILRARVSSEKSDAERKQRQKG